MEEKDLKNLGFGIILLGLLMLIFTFIQAYSYLSEPYPVLKAPESSGAPQTGQPDVNKAIMQTFMPFFGSLIPLIYSSGYLSIMGLMGFWIMGRGVQLLKAPK